MKRTRFRLWILAALALSSFAACSDDDTSMNAPPAGVAFVRAAHLSPDAPNVDVWVDGQVAVSNVPFRAFSTYLEVPAGDHRVQVTPTGATTPIVIDATLTFAEGTYTTVAAQGLLASIAANVLTDDVSPTSGRAELRFLHASPDAPPVDVTLTDGTVLFGGVSFGGSTANLPVDAGSYDLQVRAAGTSTVVLSFADVPVSAGTNYTVAAVGRLGDGSLEATVSVDSPSDGAVTVDLSPATAEVRVAHLSPDAPNVDVWVDGAVVTALVNVPFPAVSPYLSLSAATHQVQVFATGTTVNPVIDAPVTLNPGAAYTIAATGVVADLQPLVLVDDRTPAGAGVSHVRFVHASPDAPAVDVKVAGGAALFTGTAFRDFAGYDMVGPGTYDLEVRLSSNQDLALEVLDVTLDGASNSTIFAIGLVSDASLAALRVVDSN